MLGLFILYHTSCNTLITQNATWKAPGDVINIFIEFKVTLFPVITCEVKVDVLVAATHRSIKVKFASIVMLCGLPGLTPLISGPHSQPF